MCHWLPLLFPLTVIIHTHTSESYIHKLVQIKKKKKHCMMYLAKQSWLYIEVLEISYIYSRPIKWAIKDIQVTLDRFTYIHNNPTLCASVELQDDSCPLALFS